MPRRTRPIISASRNECIGGDLYLAGHDARTGEILHDATSCSMCRRMIINAGIRRVVIGTRGKNLRLYRYRTGSMRTIPSELCLHTKPIWRKQPCFMYV